MLSTRGEWFARHEGVRCSTSTPRRVASWTTQNEEQETPQNVKITIVRMIASRLEQTEFPLLTNDSVYSRTDHFSSQALQFTSRHPVPSPVQTPSTIHRPWTDLSCLNDLLWWSPAEPQTPYNNRYVPDHHHHLLGMYLVSTFNTHAVDPLPLECNINIIIIIIDTLCDGIHKLMGYFIALEIIIRHLIFTALVVVNRAPLCGGG